MCFPCEYGHAEKWFSSPKLKDSCSCCVTHSFGFIFDVYFDPNVTALLFEC